MYKLVEPQVTSFPIDVEFKNRDSVEIQGSYKDEDVAIEDSVQEERCTH